MQLVYWAVPVRVAPAGQVEQALFMRNQLSTHSSTVPPTAAKQTYATQDWQDVCAGKRHAKQHANRQEAPSFCRCQT